MRLDTGKILEIRSAAELLINSFWDSRNRNMSRGKFSPRKELAPKDIGKFSAIGIDDLRTPQLRGLFSILSAYLDGRQFSETDGRLMQACLSVPVKGVALVSDLKTGQPQLHYSAESRRVVAECLVHFLELLSTNPNLITTQPLGLCACNNIFVKTRKNQKWCSQDCYFPAWSKRKPDYWKKSRKNKKAKDEKESESDRLKILSEYALSVERLPKRLRENYWKSLYDTFNEEHGKQYGKFLDVDSFKIACEEASRKIR